MKQMALMAGAVTLAVSTGNASAQGLPSVQAIAPYCTDAEQQLYAPVRQTLDQYFRQQAMSRAPIDVGAASNYFLTNMKGASQYCQNAISAFMNGQQPQPPGHQAQTPDGTCTRDQVTRMQNWNIQHSGISAYRTRTDCWNF